MYTASLLINRPEWIAVWLAMKTAVHWQSGKGLDDGLAYRNNVWLLGTAFSLVFGIAGAMIATHGLPFGPIPK